MDTFHIHHAVRITIDSGATGNMVRTSSASKSACKVKNTSKSGHQADRSSPLRVIGETRITFTRDGREFEFDGLVVENVDIEMLGGAPFMEKNDLNIRPAKRQVIMGDGAVYL